MRRPQTQSRLINSGGGTLTTDPGSAPTPADPVTTNVTAPPGAGSGIVTIAETAIDEVRPRAATQFVGQQVDITSSVGTSPTNPLTIVFTVDESLVRAAYGLGSGDPLPGAASIAITRAEGGGSAAVLATCASLVGTGPPSNPIPASVPARMSAPISDYAPDVERQPLEHGGPPRCGQRQRQRVRAKGRHGQTR